MDGRHCVRPQGTQDFATPDCYHHWLFGLTSLTLHPSPAGWLQKVSAGRALQIAARSLTRHQWGMDHTSLRIVSPVQYIWRRPALGGSQWNAFRFVLVHQSRQHSYGATFILRYSILKPPFSHLFLISWPFVSMPRLDIVKDALHTSFYAPTECIGCILEQECVLSSCWFCWIYPCCAVNDSMVIL